MIIQQTSFNHFFSRPNTEFVIPVYQRNYAWQKQNCEQLLDDILSIAKDTNKQHFLGTITYIRHPIQPYGDEFVIIDGQQRITTLMLLLKAMQSKTKDENLSVGISSYLNLGINKDKTKLRLKPIKKDREALEYVMSGRWTEFTGFSNIKDNYRFFTNEINKVLEKGYEIGQIFNSFSQLQISMIELEQSKGDDPQLVFERINATGIHLKGLDLIRNFLMMELSPNEQERIFNYWAGIENLLGNEKDSEKIISKFISVYLRIYYGKSLKDDEKDIYNKFKQLRKNNFYNDSEKILKDMLKFARIYKMITDKNFSWEYVNEISREKRILCKKISLIDYLQFGTAYPFLMRLIDNFEISRLDFKNFNGILDLLISYFVRRAICSVATNALNDVLYSAYSKLNENISVESVAKYLGQKSGNEVFPNAVMLKLNFLNSAIFKSKKVVSLVLYEIEKLDNHEVPTLESLNIEHFYPQTPTKEWREMLGDEWNSLEQNYIDTFGNLTLTDSALNSKLSNKPFEEKVCLYVNKGSLHLNKYFCRCNKWNIDEIKKRAEWLFDKFNEVEIFRDIEDEFRQIPDKITLIDDWTGLKPRFLKLPDGSEKSVSSVRDTVKAIIEYLIENHSDELDTALKQGFEFIEFGEVENKDGAVVERFGEFTFVRNASASSLRSAMKKLVETCDLEPDEFEVITL